MSKKPKLTPWFPGHIKPVRPGVYQQKSWGDVGYQYWDGRLWRGWAATVEGAEIRKDRLPALQEFQNDSWRGLAEDPQGGKA